MAQQNLLHNLDLYLSLTHVTNTIVCCWGLCGCHLYNLCNRMMHVNASNVSDDITHSDILALEHDSYVMFKGQGSF